MGETTIIEQAGKRLPRRRHLVARFATLIATLPLLGFAPDTVDGDKQSLSDSYAISAALNRPGLDFLKLSTLNIARGRGGIEQMGAVVAQEDPNVLCIQEGTPETVNAVQRQARLGYRAAGWALKEYGNAILTDMPVQRTSTYFLHRSQGREQRSVMFTVLDNNGEDLLAINTHLDNDPPGLFTDSKQERLKQAQQINDIRTLPQYKDLPAIQCGDWNAAPYSDEYEIMTRGFTDTTTSLGGGIVTFPNFLGGGQKDYIALSAGDGWQILEQHTRDTKASDHFMLTTTVALGD